MTSNLCWRTSSYSGAEGNCVEVGTSPSVTAVRDTKDRSGGTLTFAPQRWTQFLRALKDNSYR